MKSAFARHVLALGPHGDECKVLAKVLGHLLREPVKADTWGVLSAFDRLPNGDAPLLLHIAEGLVAGRTTYGTLYLSADTRDMAWEIFEEQRDSAVYAACGALKNLSCGMSDEAYDMRLRHAIEGMRGSLGMMGAEAETLPRLPYLDEAAQL